MNLLGAFAACVFAIAIPLWYYLVSISETRYSLSMEVAFLAKSVEQIIQSQPDMWEFETVRMQEIVSQPTLHGKRCEREIRTAAGVTVAKTNLTAPPPVIKASATLFDSGHPVGSIEASLSIRTQIVFTVLLGIFSSLIGILLYIIFRTYPIKKLDSTLAELQQAEEEQRRSRDIAEQLAKEMAVIAEIGRIIGSTLDIEEVYDRFAAEAHKLIPFDNLMVNLVRTEENALIIAYVSGMDVPARRRGDRIPFRGSVCEVITKNRKGILFQADRMEEMLEKFPTLVHVQRAGLRSTMIVPLISGDKVIGALVFRSKEAAAYNDHDLHLAERIGAQIAGAIGNAQLFLNLKKTENSLRESETRFRALVEQAAVGVAEIDIVTDRFRTVNRRLCEMVGRTEAEMLAATFQTITHPEDLHLHDEKMALLLAGRIGFYTLEKRYIRKDGVVIWVDITVSPLWKQGESPGKYITVVQDITERKRMEAEMREMSLRDQLTELYNRRGFITLAEQQLKWADRAKRPMQLTFIDTDRLKWINDTLGHEAGDRVLIDTADLLRQTFRKSDIVARLGGDEFAVLSIDTTNMDQGDFSRRLQQNIDTYNAKESRPYKLSLSWGTVIYRPESSTPMSLDQLISAADALMYAQKKMKSNQRG